MLNSPNFWKNIQTGEKENENEMMILALQLVAQQINNSYTHYYSFMH